MDDDDEALEFLQMLAAPSTTLTDERRLIGDVRPSFAATVSTSSLSHLVDLHRAFTTIVFAVERDRGGPHRRSH